MATATAHSTECTHRPVGDYLLTGVFVMLLINGLQRVVGLLRGLGFCHFLSEEQLGAWALANSFFVVGVPLALLGLPGSFSKFVEHYRRRDQLGDYLVSVLAVTSLGLLATIVWILGFSQSFSWLVFHQTTSYGVTLWCAFAFVSLVLFSVVYEITASLRHVRVIATMQFLQSVVFAVVGLPLIAMNGSWIPLLPSFAIACLVAAMPGLYVLNRLHRHEFVPAGTLDRNAMWARIIPFAASLWFINLLGNMFEVSDRYMLLHLSDGGHEVGQAIVGQYHCGRILPNLLTSVAMMVGGVLLTYLSADWEAGDRERISARMRQMLQATCIGSMILSVIALIASPWLFHYGFGGRYAAAESILSAALLQAIWASLFLIAQVYMLCAERGKQLAVLMVFGLAANLGLNWFLIQRFGLQGAVAATAIAGFFTLLLLFWRMSRNGCSLRLGTVVLCATPIVVLAGPIATTIMLATIILIAGRTEWLFTAEDRLQIDAALLPKLRYFGFRFETLWP